MITNNNLTEVYIPIKLKSVKEMSKRPWIEIRKYKVDHITNKTVILKSKRQYPKEMCFETEEEAITAANGFEKPRRWGDFYEPKWTGQKYE